MRQDCTEEIERVQVSISLPRTFALNEYYQAASSFGRPKHVVPGIVGAWQPSCRPSPRSPAQHLRQALASPKHLTFSRREVTRASGDDMQLPHMISAARSSYTLLRATEQVCWRQLGVAQVQWAAAAQQPHPISSQQISQSTYPTTTRRRGQLMTGCRSLQRDSLL